MTGASRRGSPTRPPRWPATSGWAGWSTSTTTTTSPSTGRPSCPTRTTSAERFDAYGWGVEDIGEVANDLDALEAALLRARADEDRPSLIILRSHIGYPSPHLTDTAKAHGDPFPAEEIRLTKEILGLPPDERSGCPTRCSTCTGAASPAARHCGPQWDSRLAAWDGDRERFEAGLAGATACPVGRRSSPRFAPEDGPMATRQAIKACLDAIGGRDPRAHAGQRRPDRQHRHGHGRRRSPSRPTSPGGSLDPLRDPRARHGRGHDRHGRPRRRAPGRRAPSSSSATTCAVRCASPPSPTSTSSTPGPTTRSASARTGRPTSRSSSWPPCGPCPACG